MTTTQLALASLLIAVLLIAHDYVVKCFSNRREPEPADRGGVPRKSEQLKAAIACEVRNGLRLPQKTYPIGMHYAGEPIVPKRRKPRVNGKGFHRLQVVMAGENYVFIFPKDTPPTDVLIAAQEWAENPELRFNGHCEDAVLDLLIERESMLE